MNTLQRYVVMGAVVVLGIIVGLTFRVSQGQAVGDQSSGSLAVMLLASQQKDQALAQQLAAVRSELSAAQAGQTRYKTLLTELAQARQKAGLTPLSGPGVVVTLTQPPQASSAQGAFSIQDTDLLMVLNELRAAGAQGLSINGQRVVATTEVRKAGDAFSINNTSTGPPFTIEAVGSAGTMARALRLRGGIIDTLKALGIGVSIEQKALVTLPAYQGPPLP